MPDRFFQLIVFRVSSGPGVIVPGEDLVECQHHGRVADRVRQLFKNGRRGETRGKLIGRVPVDGTVNDPYPFKILIGPDNLTANGIELPDVAGAVASGTASGDWTLSCVRGQIRATT